MWWLKHKHRSLLVKDVNRIKAKRAWPSHRKSCREQEVLQQNRWWLAEISKDSSNFTHTLFLSHTHTHECVDASLTFMFICSSLIRYQAHTFQDTINTDLSQVEGELHPSFHREPPRGGRCHCLSKRDTEGKEECMFIFHHWGQKQAQAETV